MTQGPKPVGDSSFQQIQKPAEKLHSKDWNMPVRTLGDIKRLLIDAMGKKKGTELYNKFLNSIAEMSLTTVAKAQRKANEDAKKMKQLPKD